MRWADMDLLGHVNNVTYVDYLQEARIDMLAAHAPVPGTDALAEGVVVVRHDVTFVAPLVFRPEPVSIECWVVDVRAATFTVAYEVFDETPEGRVVYLRATSVLAPYVFADERPRRVSAEERAALAGFLSPALLHDVIRRGEAAVLQRVEQLQAGVDRLVKGSVDRLPPVRDLRGEYEALQRGLEDLEASLAALEGRQGGAARPRGRRKRKRAG